MGEFRNCEKCGRFFKATGDERVCSRCSNTEHEEFRLVKEFLYDNPNANILETSEATGVEERKILRFLKQGKLMVKGEGILIHCESCGDPIQTGRYCKKCEKNLSQGFKKAASELENKDQKPKMGYHTKDHK